VEGVVMMPMFRHLNCDFWKDRCVFITGATGFLGSWLLKALLMAGAQVVALVRDIDPQSEAYRSGDIRRAHVINGTVEDFWVLERAINEYEIDTVFHLAAQPLVVVARRFPLPTFSTNIVGTYNLLEACRIHRRLVHRIVIASSDKAYGSPADLPYTEDTPLQGGHPYEVSKACADLIARAYHLTYELPIAIARCVNIYGGGDANWSRLVPGTIRSLLVQQSPVIRSDGTYVREYLYVKDAVHAYLRLAERLDDSRVCGQAFNFGTGRPLTVIDMVRAIQQQMRCEHIPLDIRRCAIGEIKSQQVATEKARMLLDWTPQYDLDDGLRETIAWYCSLLGMPHARAQEGTGIKSVMSRPTDG
jgi:CDP-glucose 4,6-dehydratase